MDSGAEVTSAPSLGFRLHTIDLIKAPTLSNTPLLLAQDPRDVEKKQSPCASNRPSFNSSHCCSVGAGGCVGHPGAGSWLCWNMFFLEAGSYVLPGKNENKAPKGSLGSLRGTLRCCSVLSPAKRTIGRSSVRREEIAGHTGPAGHCLEQSRSRVLPGGSMVVPFFLGSPACTGLPTAPAWLSMEVEGHVEKAQANLESKSWHSANESVTLDKLLCPLGQQTLCYELTVLLPLPHTSVCPSPLAPTPPWPGSDNLLKVIDRVSGAEQTAWDCEEEPVGLPGREGGRRDSSLNCSWCWPSALGAG